MNSVKDICKVLSNNGIMSSKMTQIREELKKQKIYMIAEIDEHETMNNKSILEGCDHGRIDRILLKDAGDNKFSNQLSFESNGLILHSSGVVLCVPPFACNKRAKIDPKEISEYSCTPIYYGSIVNLYHYGGKWVFSTIGGYEVNHYEWIKHISYEDAFNEIISTHYKTFDYDKLDKDVCYSFVFRHVDFHPYCLSENAIYFIQAVNLIKFNETFNLEKSQCNINPGVDRIPEIKCNLKKALKLMRESHMNAINRTKGIHTDVVSMGVIFRAPYDKYGNVSNIMICSDLLKKLKLHAHKIPRSVSLETTEKRAMYLILKNYLNVINYPSFKALFPVYKPECDAMDSLLNSLAVAIIHNKNNKNARKIKMEGVDFDFCDESNFFILIKYFEDKIEGISMRRNTSKSVIVDLIRDTKHIELFLKMLVK